MTTQNVLTEVEAERARQNEKWGEQNHPDRNSRDSDWPAFLTWPFDTCASRTKAQVDAEAKIGESNYTTILLEEVFEALAETDPARLRTELIQVAAVAIQWVEAIDRRERADGIEAGDHLSADDNGGDPAA